MGGMRALLPPPPAGALADGVSELAPPPGSSAALVALAYSDRHIFR
jgi:hypothetical protein